MGVKLTYERIPPQDRSVKGAHESELLLEILRVTYNYAIRVMPSCREETRKSIDVAGTGMSQCTISPKIDARAT